MRKLLSIVFVCLLTIIFVGLYFYNRWKPLWSLENPKPFYFVSQHHDDTLRIVMIGDSWVENRPSNLNTIFQKKMSDISGRPVLFKLKGKGGEKSRGIYQLMFEDGVYGTKSLLSSGADYCVVFAGINDAAANLGKKQYVHNMQLILDFLLANRICPVLIEIPDVDIWNVYGDKPVKDLMVDYIRSLFTRCDMYNYLEYRDAFESMLNDRNLYDYVIFVSMRGWNGVGNDVNKELFLNDKMHLNIQGYAKLDSCIMDAIQKNLH